MPSGPVCAAAGLGCAWHSAAGIRRVQVLFPTLVCPMTGVLAEKIVALCNVRSVCCEPKLFDTMLLAQHIASQKLHERAQPDCLASVSSSADLTVKPSHALAALMHGLRVRAPRLMGVHSQVMSTSKRLAWIKQLLDAMTG